MKLIPKPRYLLVFAVRGKRKLGSFYMPTKGSVADYHTSLPVLVAEMGTDVRITAEGVKPGTKGYIQDAYELEDLPVNLWSTYRYRLPMARVVEFEKDAADGDGFICGNIIHEASLFAVEDAHG